MNIYENNLYQVPANFEALTPLKFMQHAAMVYPNKLAIVHGEIRRTWAQTYARCRQLAHRLKIHGVGIGDTVAVLSPNLPEHFEVHFGVPMAGAVLNSINTRLDARTVAFILQHAEAKILITEREFSGVVKEALALLNNPDLLVIDIVDPTFDSGEYLGSISYDDFIAQGDENFIWSKPTNEWNAISLNYTSGTTGDPKGVVYHHRGAYLNAISNVMSWGMQSHAVYLWTLPMFHCNGWCFPWSIAAIAGVNVCLRHVRGEAILTVIEREKVEYLCGAPMVFNIINDTSDVLKERIKHPVKAMVAGAPPPPAIIQKVEAMGFTITHTYGLTETYGPSVVCAWQEDWQEHPADHKAKLKARQGVPVVFQDDLMVADPITMQPVAKDGQTLGEIFMRGNVVMKGYLKNPKTTNEAFEGGWFHSGDIAVWHEDSYIEIKDRSKDVIISGGENISSIELEEILFRHPSIQDAAVVAKPDEKWGEVPCAFIKLKTDAVLSAEEVIEFCRANTARFKVPKHVIFIDIPRTPTGKVQKFILREWAKNDS
ncbi:MAG: acyl-CoA synthetase [Candidatus Saccharibacteria bacterium]|nr:acyl-CoA synthetase [Moraxellaceae bacterium]